MLLTQDSIGPLQKLYGSVFIAEWWRWVWMEKPCVEKKKDARRSSMNPAVISFYNTKEALLINWQDTQVVIPTFYQFWF